ncbi:MAG: pyridoxal-phosphate dependent enzyme [Chitinophagales bacterium]
MITPLQELYDPLLASKQVQVFMKRDDLLHPQVSGNKWRKLKYNLKKAKVKGNQTLLTFGGAYSNHIFAVAAAGKEFRYKTIGIIRGEKPDPLNETLSFAIACGMQLDFISRTSYGEKEEPHFIKSLHEQFGDFYLLPEGGTNGLAVKGCEEIIAEIEVDYNYLCCSCGTGGTLSGLIAGDQGTHKLLGFSALRGLRDLEGKIEELVTGYSNHQFSNWSINHDYHFGGYAKVNALLFSFIREFYLTQNILLDPVYTGKMMFGIYDLVRNNFFMKGSVIIAIHTGGLQGWNGMNDELPKTTLK